MSSSHPTQRRAQRPKWSRSPLPLMGAIVVLIGVIGAAGVLRAADARTAEVERIDGLGAVLAAVPSGDGVLADGQIVTYPAENYLLVGSDSREGLAEGADSQVIGGTDDVGGRRSDTIMVLRQERDGGASLMSIPRDLWVPIAGTGGSGRINEAYAEGPERLAATVTEALGIPIHHYVEVNFQGFKDIIDRLGGVDLCVDAEARDTHSGLSISAGCQRLDGLQALAYARSRYYQTWTGEEWQTDGRADLGRIERQQFFIRSAVNGALAQIQSSPFSSGNTISAIVSALRIDDQLDPIEAAQALRQAFQTGLRTFALPVYNDTVGNAQILRMGDSADALLAYFRGDAPAPVEFETTAVTQTG
ncbi:MAG TPA: LCP family protein [Ilumatobacter sp.]|nr:LCP family protein [Ilumatobacter sp.]